MKTRKTVALLVLTGMLGMVMFACTTVVQCPPRRVTVNPPPVETHHRVPRLILQITVDQLRGDMLARYGDRFDDWGLGYFTENGIWYDNANFSHANTVTVVGHTTLATGTWPAHHGMVGNEWYDGAEGAVVYNVKDTAFPILSTGDGKDATGDGRSPRTIRASTFADELFVHYGEQSKVFAVSVKDRGAIPMAGYGGKAFWFSKQSGEFVTSAYYYDAYPEWVTDWNAADNADRWRKSTWSLLRDRDTYIHRDMDDRPYERDLDGFGTTFPHSFKVVPDEAYYNTLANSPMGDVLTAEFAVELMTRESLGVDDIPDYLSVSFSATDYVGHYFGPSSLEFEDNILRLDRTIAAFLTHVAETVGLENTLIVLSADHGTPEAPEYAASLGMNAKRLDPQKLDRTALYEELKERFGVGEEVISQVIVPYIYLNHSLMEEKKLDAAEVARTVAAFYQGVEGIAHAVATADLMGGNVPSSPLMDQLTHNFHPGRSGDVQIVREQYWHVQVVGDTELVALHGSPWGYDTYVPIVFAGNSLSAARISRPVDPMDIAATLSAYLGVKPPSKSRGVPLTEVLSRHRKK